ncbi:unnamed protein product, partial [Symbiodinium necroappetens]
PRLLRRGWLALSVLFDPVMDFATLTSFETGSVEVLEFSWPPAAEDQTPQACLAYVIMKRPSGFLLCVPDGFLSQVELEQGQQAGEEEGIGPSIGISAPPVQLTPTGEWISPADPETVQALIVDLASHLADQLSPADLSADDLVCFRPGSPSVFPLASEVLRQAKEWLQADGTLPADRPTMVQLASQQAKMMEVVDPPPAPQPALPHPVLSQPLAQTVLPPFQSVPKNLAATLGPPPLTRQQPPAAHVQVDLEEKGQRALQTGEPLGVGQDASLASAVLAQSQALVALVSQLSGSSADPLLEVPTGQASVRGAAGRAKLQQDLASRSGVFAQKVRENMTRRMDPTGLLPEDQVSFLRYLERHGGYSAQPLLGLVAWQVAQALDLIAIGATEGAKDSLSLLLLMLDQTAHDRGNSSLGWLLTLQADPPSNLFAAQTAVPGSNLQSFSPLAEQRWITIALAYAKELETISSRISETQPKASTPKPPVKPPATPHTPAAEEEQQLSKKQLRAAQWAARKAAGSSKSLSRVGEGSSSSPAALAENQGASVNVSYQAGPQARCTPPAGPNPVPSPPGASSAPAFELGFSSSPDASALPSSDGGAPDNDRAGVFPLQGLLYSEAAEFSFHKWLAVLPRLLKAGNTQLSRFLVSTFALRKEALPSSAALFPLPLFYEGVFHQRTCRSAKATLRGDVARCTHLVAMCLNFMHAGCKPVPLRSLQRPLTPLQTKVYARIQGLVRACARQAGAVPTCAGRKGLQLAARLSEVVVFLRDQGFEAGGYPSASEPPVGFVPHAPEGPDALRPYRDILADQVVLHGRGSWDLSAHLGPELYLPYVEPDCFRFAGTGGPCATFLGENKREILKLARIWDAAGLLSLTAGPLPDRLLTRVFRAYKAPGKQRQIGDRRGQNSWESRLAGPSKWLPTGPLLCRLHVPEGFCAVGSVTDRRDFYTQAMISPQRASTNLVGPAVPLSWLAGTVAEASFRERPRVHCIDPALYAEQLEFDRPALLAPDKQAVHLTFQALFQGDAGGVEFATAGHEGLLQGSGCLLGPGRLQSSHPVAPAGPWQGLIIDDFFAIAVQPGGFLAGTPSPSSSELIDRAKIGYRREAVLGSDDKDVRDQRHFKVAGAEIDSSESTVADGMTLCGYPVAKRIALAAASVRAAQCPALSEELVSTLCGSWVSCLLYRRCLMSALDRLFSLGRAEAAPPDPGSDLKPLPRKTASELQLLAVLAPVAVSNLSAEPDSRIFASDASMEKGAYCATEVPPEVALQLWLASDFEGEAVTLQASGSHRHPPGGVSAEGPCGPTEETDAQFQAPALAVAKPFAFEFEVLEVGEPSPLRSEVKARGLKVGPELHAARSPHYDLGSFRFCEWLVHLVSSGRVRAILLRPPVNTFARAGCPPLRSALRPLGFRPGFGPVLRANTVASLSCWSLPAMKLQPASSTRLPPFCASIRSGFPLERKLLSGRSF